MTCQGSSNRLFSSEWYFLKDDISLSIYLWEYINKVGGFIFFSLEEVASAIHNIDITGFHLPNYKRNNICLC